MSSHSPSSSYLSTHSTSVHPYSFNPVHFYISNTTSAQSTIFPTSPSFLPHSFTVVPTVSTIMSSQIEHHSSHTPDFQPVPIVPLQTISPHSSPSQCPGSVCSRLSWDRGCSPSSHSRIHLYNCSELSPGEHLFQCSLLIPIAQYHVDILWESIWFGRGSSS